MVVYINKDNRVVDPNGRILSDEELLALPAEQQKQLRDSGAVMPAAKRMTRKKKSDK